MNGIFRRPPLFLATNADALYSFQEADPKVEIQFLDVNLNHYSNLDLLMYDFSNFTKFEQVHLL